MSVQLLKRVLWVMGPLLVSTMILPSSVAAIEPADDFSKVTDPDVLLDRLAQGKLQHLMFMTGGMISQHPKTAPQAFHVKMWEKAFAIDKPLDHVVQRLIEMGDKAISPVNQRMKAMDVKDPMVERLALVLYSTGDAESVSALIDFLEKTENNPVPVVSESDNMPLFAATTAMWHLTGRKHLFTGRQWRHWWVSVKQDFVPLRNRQRPEFVAIVTAERVDELVKKLAISDVPARERLVILGPPSVPYLLTALSAELAKSPKGDEGLNAVPMTPLARRLAWVIDELGGTDKLPASVRNDYFTDRLAKFNLDSPIDDDAACRAISNCSLAEICTICFDQSRIVAKLPPEQRRFPYVNSLGKWINGDPVVIDRRLGSKPKSITGDPSNWPHWNLITPAESPRAEVDAAVPILIRGLDDPEAGVRTAAASLAGKIGFHSDERPEPLIVALRDRWLSESDDTVRSNVGFAMTRFTDWRVSNPIVLDAVSKGLLSDRAEIVSDAASLVGSVRLELNDQTRPAFDKLVELTHHENDKFRRRAVYSLRLAAPKLLEPELERLASDKVDDIRKECASALRSKPDSKFADILFKLANDLSEQVRMEALHSIGGLKDPESMKRLIPFLKDPKIGGLAISAMAEMAEMGGKDALPLMMAELESGNDVFGLIYQHLRRLTGEGFGNQPELWLEWWKTNQPATKADPPKKD